MNCKAIDLNRVIAKQRTLLQGTLGTNISLVLDLGEAVGSVAVDEAMVHQILTSLAENAKRAMPGGGLLTIQTEFLEVDDAHAQLQPGARPGQFVRISVADNGSGMTLEQIQQAFRPREANASHHSSLGLGLMAGIARRTHGWLEISSQRAAGTTVRIYIPQFQPDHASLRPWAVETILLVDDEFAIRSMLRSVLTRAGYEVIEADNGLHALSLWEDCKPRTQLLLTDLIMPNSIGGQELAQRLLAAKPGLKVIYTSGFNMSEELHTDRLNQGIRFLQKPYDMRTLLETVQATLNEPSASLRPAMA